MRRPPVDNPPAKHNRPWLAPPQAQIAGTLHVGQIIADSPAVRVALTHVSAFKSGCLLHFIASARPSAKLIEQAGGLRSLLQGCFSGVGPLIFDVSPEEPAGNTLESRFLREDLSHEPPTATVVVNFELTGSTVGEKEVELRQSVWLWPLPKPATVPIGVTWRHFGLERQEFDLDGESVRYASERSRALWSDL